MRSPELLLKLGAIGDRPEDSEDERLRHRLLVYMGVLMSAGGVLWGTIAAGFGLYLPAIVPYGYVVLTVINLSYLAVTKDFRLAQGAQVLMSLLLPFLFQWSLGGFIESGAVMLWAMVAIVGSHTFGNTRSSLAWLGMYVVLTCVSGALDATVAERFGNGHPPAIVTLFFVTNLVILPSVVFGLTIWLLDSRDAARKALQDANHQISHLNDELEDKVAKRTRELREALAESRAIVHHLADGLVAIGTDGQVRTVNPALSGLLYLNSSLTGQSAADVLPAELVSLAERSIATDDLQQAEIRLPGDRIGAAVATPIDKEGAAGAVVIVRDVTLDKEIDRMKTDFIATVSHELRTPLTSVLGFAKLTLNKLESTIFPVVPEGDRKVDRATRQIRANVGIIVSEGERLTTLINDVLDISKMEAGRMEWKRHEVDPAELAHHAIDASSGLFPADSPVQLYSDIEDGLPSIIGDRDRLMQVLLNLISNGSKFTEQGSVTLIVRATSDSVRFEVIDTGMGIEPAKHADIFEKFRQVGDTMTNKPQGTGLGLPICRQIVQAHGSDLSVRSAPGEGSVFSFELNTPDARALRATPRMSGLVDRIDSYVGRLPNQGGDILVVDDDQNLRELLRQQLGERGFQVREAVDGSGAIAQVRDNPPDLVILDVMMPGLSGFDVAAVLKSDPSTVRVPILVLSNLRDLDRGEQVGVDGYMTKPADSDDLVTEVERLMTGVHHGRRVLIVDEEQPPSASVVALLTAQGFEVVGTCSGEDCLEQARATMPDLIVLEAVHEHTQDLVRAIQLQKGLEDVFVVQMMTRAPRTPPT